MKKDIFFQLPLKIKLTSNSSWIGTSTYSLTIDELSSITFAHHKKDLALKQITNTERNQLLGLIQKIQIPFTKIDENYIETFVCDGGSFDLQIKSKTYKVSFSFIDGQDEVSNKSIIDVANFIYELVDTSEMDLSFGSLE